MQTSEATQKDGLAVQSHKRIQQSHFLIFTPNEIENICSYENLSADIYKLFVHIGQNLEATKRASEWINENSVVHSDNGCCFVLRKKELWDPETFSEWLERWFSSQSHVLHKPDLNLLLQFHIKSWIWWCMMCVCNPALLQQRESWSMSAIQCSSSKGRCDACLQSSASPAKGGNSTEFTGQQNWSALLTAKTTTEAVPRWRARADVWKLSIYTSTRRHAPAQHTHTQREKKKEWIFFLIFKTWKQHKNLTVWNKNKYNQRQERNPC